MSSGSSFSIVESKFSLAVCSFSFVLCSFSIVVCSFSIVVYSFSIVVCSFSIVLCSFSIVVCSFRYVVCSFKTTRSAPFDSIWSTPEKTFWISLLISRSMPPSLTRFAIFVSFVNKSKDMTSCTAMILYPDADDKTMFR
jgi:hypothetical protein